MNKNISVILLILTVVALTAIAPLSISQGIAGGLDGAKVFEQNCGRCHLPRQPKERSDRQWKIIMAHMRVRANLTAEEAEAVLKYLQSSN